MKLCIMGTEYTDCREDIQPMLDVKNYNALLFFSALFTGLLALISIMSLFIDAIKGRFPFYMVGCGLSLSMCFIARMIYRNKRNSRLLLFMLYFIIVCGYILSLFISLAARSAIPAVTFNVMLVALPLFICDAPWHIDLMLVIVLVPFLISSYIFKPLDIFWIDLVDGIAFFIVAVCANTNTQCQRFADFNNRHIIKGQRDTDPLTGLLTKKAFEINVEKVLCNEAACGALIAIDIDNYRDITASHGVPFGDSVLSQTGKHLRTCCRVTDFVGRLSGDEFAVFMTGFVDKELVRHKIHEVMDLLKNHFAETMELGSYTVSVGCTIVSSFNSSQPSGELFSRMEHALYIAKNSGRDKCCFYGE